ncbi:MAG: hypothetical protein WBC91_14905 [Phototrophicaceae bacterium]
MIRWQLILTIISLLIVIIAMAISPFLPTKIGVLEGFGLEGFGNDGNATFGNLYLDLDTGLIAQENTDINMPTFNLPYNQMLTSIGTDTDRTYYFTRSDDATLRFIRHDDEPITIREYDAINPIGLYWETRYETLLLVDSSPERGTLLYSLDIATGDLTELLAIVDLNTGFVRPSPDERYLLLREAQENTYRSVVAPKPIIIFDTQTNTISELGSPDFAYWSPDSTQLAIGYASDTRFYLDVSIYDLATGETQNLGLQTSHLDTPFFADLQGNGVLWSPDSQALAIINQYEETLYFVSLVDEHVDTISDSNLKPLSWSPNGTYLLTTGYYEDQIIGAYVVDFETLAVNRIQTVGRVEPWNSRLLWSPNGRYVGLIRSGTSPDSDILIIIYDATGQIVRQSTPFAIENGINVYYSTINWADER